MSSPIEFDVSPIITVVEHSNNTCAVNRTNFLVRVDPQGMAAVLTVDPDARFHERYAHRYGVSPALMRSSVRGWVEQLNTLPGYLDFYNYCARQLRYETAAIAEGVIEGFLYDVDCHKDSPLIGWFLVLGVENG